MKSSAFQKNLLKISKMFLDKSEYRMASIIVLLAIILSIGNPYFATFANFKVLTISIAEDSLMIIGMTLLIISGVFDLSVGATLAFAGVCAAKLVLSGVPVFLALIISVLLSGLIGVIIGLLVALGRVNALIASLSMTYVIRGLTLAITRGFPVSMMPESYSALGQGYVASIPNTVIIMAVVLVVFILLLKYFTPLRSVYFMGGNEEAAKLAGFSTKTIRISLFAVMGLLAGLAGVIVSSRLASAGVNFGVGTELRIIAATVIGGVSLQGGKGNIIGAFLGLLFLAMITNALVLLNVSIYYQSLITGIILIIAVLLDQLQNRNR